LHHDNHRLTIPFSPENFWLKATWLSSPTHPTHLTWPHSLSPIEDKAERPPVRHSWGDRQNCKWCWTPSENTTSRMHLKMAEALGTVRTRGRGLLRGWWWPVGPDDSTSPRNYGYRLIHVLQQNLPVAYSYPVTFAKNGFR
jgi:hypothetical protein